MAYSVSPLSPNINEKKQIFIEALKTSYKKQYDAVQPIPYIKDRLYCVDKVFVEGRIDGFIETDTSEGSWERLESYSHIFSNARMHSVRRIIEGEPGYGKSTLTLQLAYDWCNGVRNSPFADTDILILLKLRQLGNVQTLVRAIKLFLLRKESRIRQSDIRDILENCKSVKILLDGYDEYPEKDSDKRTDVNLMVKSEKFNEFDFTLTTRYLPKQFDKSATKQVKLKGFDEEARDQYIRKAVTGPDDKAGFTKIKRDLKNNPILDDLCQVPLFFVTFAHMTHERGDFKKFKSVTEFFIYMMECFHRHTERKAEEQNVRPYDFDLDAEHTELDKVAFEGLNRNNQQIVWDRETLRKRLGQVFYDHYIRVGILVEEEVFDKNGETGKETKIQVSFHHKIFCEWFASFEVMGIAAGVRRSADLERLIGKMDPFDLQYVYRFACGLNQRAADNIIKYLKKRKDCDKFAVLCILEKSGDIKEIKQTITELCSDRIIISDDDSKLLQRSTVQLLQIASSHDIAISDLFLKLSFSKVDEGDIVLQSGLRLPSLSSLEKISINANRAELSEDDVIGLLNYGLQSQIFKKIRFFSCKLPESFRCDIIPALAKTRNIKVLRPSHASQIDLQSTGKWTKVTEIKDIRELCSSTVVIDYNTSESVQRSVIDVLVKAASHDIPISCVYLFESFHSVGVDGIIIILNSGLSLPILSTLERMAIRTEEGREIDEDEANGILNHLTHSKRLKRVIFDYCLLPSLLSGPFLSVLKSKNVNVCWLPYGSRERSYQLDHRSGYWQLDEGTASLFPTKSPGDELTVADYNKEVNAFRTYYRKKIMAEKEIGF